MQSLETYLEALGAQDWERLSATLAEEVHRTGPYLDVVRGREAYVAFLSRAVTSLPNYELRVTRIRELGPGSALVELSEILDVEGVRTEFPEALIFDLDQDGLISRVDIYIKQPPTRRAGEGSPSK